MAETKFEFNMSDISKLTTAAKSVKDKVLAGAGLILLRSTRERFHSGRGPKGRPWIQTKYRPTEIHRQRTNARGETVTIFGNRNRRWQRTLMGSNHLFRSVVTYFKGENSVAVGSGLIYAKTHQEGADFKATPKQSLWLFHNVFRPAHGKQAGYSKAYRIKIPARPFIGISKEDERLIHDMAGREIVRGLN